MRSGSDHRLSVADGEDLVSPADETMNNDGPFPIAFILGAFRAMWDDGVCVVFGVLHRTADKVSRRFGNRSLVSRFIRTHNTK